VTDVFGARMRRERERRHISLSSIASATNIRATLFEQLERGDVSRWPSGIFRRAFMRAYASAIGLDPEATVREFLEAHPDPALPLETAAGVATAHSPRPRAGRPADIRLFLADEGVDLRRWLALFCDTVALAAIGLAAFLAVGSFWMPIAIATFVYYSAGTIFADGSPVAFLLRRLRRGPVHTAESDADTLIGPFLVHPERGHSLSLDLSPQSTAASQR
jgi:transcriptional regulator with XRE-family HTH domain